MRPAERAISGGAASARLEAENVDLRERLESAERYVALTLARATRLSQVISALADNGDLDTLVERAAVELAELFAADIAVLMLGPDDACAIRGHWGVRASHVPGGTFVLPGLERLTTTEPVLIGAAAKELLPEWLAGYGAQHAAWARLLVGEESRGLLLLVRREPEPFELSDGKELRAIAYRTALSVENGLLHERMTGQIARLHRIQELTAQLAGTLELEPIARRVAEMVVEELSVSASRVAINRGGELVTIATHGPVTETTGWERFPLEAPGQPLGCVDIAAAPAEGSEERELLLHLLGLAALALDKALLYDRSREQARRDSLTGLLGHRVFHEVLEEQAAREDAFSIALVDIDDFKQINDLYGHQAGDDALRLVADALRQGLRECDSVFRIGGEEFCVVLPGLEQSDAFQVAERLRGAVAALRWTVPLTVSLGISSFPSHAASRDELLSHADAALYVSKRGGKNCTTVAGAELSSPAGAVERHSHLELLGRRDPTSVGHSIEVAILAVEIGRALGLDDVRLAELRTAATFHDIGKVGVPPEILAKPGPLDEEEFRVVKTHPLVGAELLRAWGLADTAELVLNHHERVDGTGYPNGRRGDEIPLESRIIHVADAYVAMTLDRPYRRAMDSEAAVAELMRHRGTQFDPAVVDALVALDRQTRAA